MSLRAACLVATLCGLLACAAVRANEGDGDAMYRRGVLPDGRPVQASRIAGGKVQGAAVACVNCHQRSGLGGREGRVAVPPITGRYLFRGAGGAGAADPSDLPYVEGMRGDRPPYTAATLVRALREGVDSAGRSLADVMPRYQLEDHEAAALVDYLRDLDRVRVPGVTPTRLHFATIVTPDADPVKKRGMLDVMARFVDEHNVRQMTSAPAMKTSARTAYARSMFMVHRQWDLHVWELTGAPATWQSQLEKRLAEEPVFAVISGLGGRDWAPVHAFCERAAVPCLFPNAEVPPPQADHDFYSLYFSRGVLLEADLAARALQQPPAGRGSRVVEIFRAGDVGAAAAQALAGALDAGGVTVTSLPVAQDAPRSAVTEAVAAALAGPRPPDALMLWLRPEDLAALPDPPHGGTRVLVSGQMAGLERAPLPDGWRDAVHLLYPYDLPQRRRVRVDYAMGWMAAQHIPVRDEQVQVDTYLVLGLVSETLMHMTDAFVRDYLVERLQNTLDHRIVTGFYPRLSLAAGQRFASKGGLIVRFDPKVAGRAVIPETDWMVP